VVKSIRITASIANWSVRLPTIALLVAQGGAMASTISFPMLAPLLLGTGQCVQQQQQQPGSACWQKLHPIPGTSG
jgi:hypothetical protein